MPPAPAEGGDDGKQQAAAKRESPREIFVERFQGVNRFVIENVGEDSMMTKGQEFDFEHEESKQKFKMMLLGYVPHVVLEGNWKDQGFPPKTNPKKKAKGSSQMCYRSMATTLVLVRVTESACHRSSYK